MLFLRRQAPRFLFILALAFLGVGLCALLLPIEYRAVSEQLIGFPDSDVKAHQARPAVLAALCFLPLLAYLVYRLGGILDRYITRQFLGIFGICLSALLMILLLADLSDHISDFRKSEHMFRAIGTYYATRLPAILLLLLPYSLLLSLLHSLSKLSTNREIIAMIQAGRGIVRLILPLTIAGVFFTLFCLGLNYHLAPTAEGRRHDILDESIGKPVIEASKVLYHNREDRRLWMIEDFPSDYQHNAPLLNVEVTTTDENHKLVSRLTATEARWSRSTRQWTFENPVLGRFAPGGPPKFDNLKGPLTIDGWSETPWQLIKPGLSARDLGIPDLNGWFQANALRQPFADASPYLTQWHYRWAMPFTCMVTILLATPLAIHFSRRGSGGGIFSAIILSALMLLVSNILLALGAVGILRPVLAAWLPNLAFALLGIGLLRSRFTSRPIHYSLRKLFLTES